MKRGRSRGSEQPILIDLGEGARSATPAEGSDGDAGFPAVRVRDESATLAASAGRRRRSTLGAPTATRRAAVGVTLLAVVGVWAPTLMPMPRPVFDPGALEPYPTAPVEAWRISPTVVKGDGDGVDFRPVVIDESYSTYTALDPWRDYPDVWRYDSTVVAAVDRDQSLANLVAVDVRSGAVRWSIATPVGREYRGCARELLSGAMPCIRDGGDSSRGNATEVVLIRLTDGRELARWGAPAWARTVEVLGDSLLLAGAAPANSTALTIARHDAWSGAERWTYQGQHDLWPVTIDGVVQGSDDRATTRAHFLGVTIVAPVGDRVIASLDGVIAVVDATTGEPGRAVEYGSARPLTDGSVIVRRPSDAVTAAGTAWANDLSENDWADAEQYPADGGDPVRLPGTAGRLVPAIGFGKQSPAIVTDAREVLVASAGRSAQPWSVADADSFWPQVVTPAGVWGGPGVTFGAGSDYELRDLATGRRLWAQANPNGTFVQVCGTDGERLIVLQNNADNAGQPELVAFDLANGSRVWTVALSFGERATVVDGRIVVFSRTAVRGFASRGR